MEQIRREPVVFTGLLEALAVAIMGVLLITETVTDVVAGSILVVISALLAFIPFFVRGQVTPVLKIDEEANLGSDLPE